VIEKKLVVDYGDQKSMIQIFLGSVWKKISYIPKKKNHLMDQALISIIDLIIEKI
jgi:hypothetical protein